MGVPGIPTRQQRRHQERQAAKSLLRDLKDHDSRRREEKRVLAGRERAPLAEEWRKQKLLADRYLSQRMQCQARILTLYEENQALKKRVAELEEMTEEKN